jgi:hypothetical protein
MCYGCAAGLGRADGCAGREVSLGVIQNVGTASEIGTEMTDGTLTVRMQCAEAQAGTPGWPEIERVLSAQL